jgi:hypothetical protein
MANEYLTHGTLLGKPPPQDSNTERHEVTSATEEESPESRREKERLYYTLADLLRAGDVHIPGIVNPSQLAAWLGLQK